MNISRLTPALLVLAFTSACPAPPLEFSGPCFIDDCPDEPSSTTGNTSIDGDDSSTSTGGEGSTGDPTTDGSSGETDASSTGEPADPCDPNPCQNGGSCEVVDDSETTCACLPGYSGDRCEVIDADPTCNPNPCQNGGTCTQTDDGVTCGCPPKFEGRRCEIDKAACVDHMCQNGGRCGDDVDGGCMCQDGYEGRHCETNIDDCEPNPCQNGGVCTDAVDGFSCACIDGFEGETCETNIDDCTDDACGGNGTCVDEVNGFSCACNDGHVGDRCECVVGLENADYSRRRDVLTVAAGVEYPAHNSGIVASSPAGLRVGPLGLWPVRTIGAPAPSIEFRFGRPSRNTSYIATSLNQNTPGEVAVEAFRADGTSLGVQRPSGRHQININTLFNTDEWISGFTITMDAALIRIQSVTIEPVDCRPDRQ